MNFRELPFLRISIPFVIGILLYPNVFYLGDHYYALICASFLLFIFFDERKFPLKHNWLKGLSINLILILLGIHVAHINDQSQWKNHLKTMTSNSEALIVRIQKCDTLSKSNKIIGRVVADLDSNSILESRSGLVSINTKIDYQINNIKTGDIAVIKGKVYEFSPPKNPCSFDLKAFYANKQLYHKIQLDTLIILQKSKHTYAQKILSLRNDLLQVFDENMPFPKENAIAKALLLGYKTELDEETKTAYANTGALHILAVSGLHVGILCMILLTLFNFIPFENNASKLLKILIILACLYFYCSLTGSTASVMRASIMYGCLLIGNELKRFSNIYNTIAASAFIILWIDPVMLKTVSFQLSYLALIGIVYFQPKIYVLWIPKNKIINFVWKLMCVSLAAQLITFPISIYYFNQLPLLSCISGIVAVPAAFAIFSLGIVVLLLNFIAPILLWPVSKILFGVIWINNQFILCLQKIPHHKLINLSLQTIDVWILYIILLTAMIFISFRAKKFLMLSLILSICLSAKLIASLISIDKENTMVYYYTPNAYLIDFYEGRKLYSIRSEKLSKKQEEYAAKAFRLEHKSLLLTDQEFEKYHFIKDGLILFGEQSIFLLNKNNLTKFDHKMEVDVLVLQEEVGINESDLLSYFEPKIVILDTSNSRRYNKKWGYFLGNKSIPFHDIYTKGAYIN